jgi:hypothetical protein
MREILLTTQVLGNIGKNDKKSQLTALPVAGFSWEPWNPLRGWLVKGFELSHIKYLGKLVHICQENFTFFSFLPNVFREFPLRKRLGSARLSGRPPPGPGAGTPGSPRSRRLAGQQLAITRRTALMGAAGKNTRPSRVMPGARSAAGNCRVSMRRRTRRSSSSRPPAAPTMSPCTPPRMPPQAAPSAAADPRSPYSR